MTYYEDLCAECESKRAAGIPIPLYDLRFWIKIREGGTKPDACPRCGKGKPLFWQEDLVWLCRKCSGNRARSTPIHRPGCAAGQFVKGRVPWNKGIVKSVPIIEPKRPDESQHTKIVWHLPVQEPSILEKSCLFGRFF